MKWMHGQYCHACHIHRYTVMVRTGDLPRESAVLLIFMRHFGRHFAYRLYCAHVQCKRSVTSELTSLLHTGPQGREEGKRVKEMVGGDLAPNYDVTVPVEPHPQLQVRLF